MDQEKKTNGCSLENEYIQTLLDNMCSGSSYNRTSLKTLINGYYKIYLDAHDYFEKYKEAVVKHARRDIDLIIRNMRIENISQDNDLVYSFEFVADVPLSFRLPCTLDTQADKSSKFKYVGDNEENLSYIITRIAYSDEELSALESALRNQKKINKSYTYKLLDSLPYVVYINNKHITISDANDQSNNIIPIVEIDLEEKTIQFNESIDKNEFTAIFKDYLVLLLENADVDEQEIRKELGYIGSYNFEFVNFLLNKYDMFGKKDNKQVEKEKDPRGREAYYLNVPNEGYKLIGGYSYVGYNKEYNCYDFRFRDYSVMSIPASSLIKVDGRGEQVGGCDAYMGLKKLVLNPKDKDKE